MTYPQYGTPEWQTLKDESEGKVPQQPTVAELEEAITHLKETCKRYGPHALKYGEWHEEINHLLDDRESALLTGSPGVL